ncbi:hypothetical protein DdX_02191 [Ditylenchus destructor]|uniref:Uncharacterized protein n=1 Tax=Ditylenchus destructor TaxID=166010 RepID=A0AAD4NFN6_9BILA|nr:hypothetical protein DdX_02191 [Ditylenchus destructor]
MCCCCLRLHRHQVHLISYGCVSFSLITTGLVFTVFAIFQKDSQIGKVWLAGPTTMVIIDWGPAMAHGREGSIDSRLMDQLTLTNALPTGGVLLNGNAAGQLKAPLPLDNLLPSPHYNGRNSLLTADSNSSLGSTQFLTGRTIGSVGGPSVFRPTKTSVDVTVAGCENDEAGKAGAIDCIVYGQFDGLSNSNTPSIQCSHSHNENYSDINRISALQTALGNHREKNSVSIATQTHPMILSNPAYPEIDEKVALNQSAECCCDGQVYNYAYSSMSSVREQVTATTRIVEGNHNHQPQYGSMDARTGKNAQGRSEKCIYQGETFMLNQRSFFI